MRLVAVFFGGVLGLLLLAGACKRRKARGGLLRLKTPKPRRGRWVHGDVRSHRLPTMESMDGDNDSYSDTDMSSPNQGRRETTEYSDDFEEEDPADEQQDSPVRAEQRVEAADEERGADEAAT